MTLLSVSRHNRIMDEAFEHIRPIRRVEALSPLPELDQVRSIRLHLDAVDRRTVLTAFAARLIHQGGRRQHEPVDAFGISGCNINPDHATGVMTHHRRPINVERVERSDRSIGVHLYRSLPRGPGRTPHPERVNGDHPQRVGEQRQQLPVLVPRAWRLMQTQEGCGRGVAGLSTVDLAERRLEIREPQAVNHRPPPD